VEDREERRVVEKERARGRSSSIAPGKGEKKRNSSPSLLCRGSKLESAVPVLPFRGGKIWAERTSKGMQNHSITITPKKSRGEGKEGGKKRKASDYFLSPSLMRKAKKAIKGVCYSVFIRMERKGRKKVPQNSNAA